MLDGIGMDVIVRVGIQVNPAVLILTLLSVYSGICSTQNLSTPTQL